MAFPLEDSETSGKVPTHRRAHPGPQASLPRKSKWMASFSRITRPEKLGAVWIQTDMDHKQPVGVKLNCFGQLSPGPVSRRHERHDTLPSLQETHPKREKGEPVKQLCTLGVPLGNLKTQGNQLGTRPAVAPSDPARGCSSGLSASGVTESGTSIGQIILTRTITPIIIIVKTKILLLSS